MGIDVARQQPQREEDAFAGLIVGSGIDWPKGSDNWLIGIDWDDAHKKARLQRHAIVFGCLCALVPPLYLLLNDGRTPNTHIWLLASPFAIFILSLAGTCANRLINPAIGLQAPLFIAVGWAIVTDGASSPGSGSALICYGFSLLVISMFHDQFIKKPRLRLMTYALFGTVFLIEGINTIVNWTH